MLVRVLYFNLYSTAHSSGHIVVLPPVRFPLTHNWSFYICSNVQNIIIFCHDRHFNWTVSKTLGQNLNIHCLFLTPAETLLLVQEPRAQIKVFRREKDASRLDTGVDLSKILGGQTNILGGQKVVKSDKCMGVSQLLGGRARAAPPKSTPMQVEAQREWLYLERREGLAIRNWTTRTCQSKERSWGRKPSYIVPPAPEQCVFFPPVSQDISLWP